jgi:hypothetical protein
MKSITILVLLFSTYALSQEKQFLYERSYNYNNEVYTSARNKFNLDIDFPKNFQFKAEVVQENFVWDIPTLNLDKIENLYGIDLQFIKKLSINKKTQLEINVNPMIRSLFNENLKIEDVFFNGSLRFNYLFTNKTEIKFGLARGLLFGSPKFYPILEFKSNFDSKINFNIGFPATAVSYKVNNKNMLKAEVLYDSYFTNVSGNLTSRFVDGQIQNFESIFISRLNTNIKYEYLFENKHTIGLGVGKNFNNEIKFQETNLNQTNLKFDNQFIVSLNFKYNIK